MAGQALPAGTADTSTPASSPKGRTAVSQWLNRWHRDLQCGNTLTLDRVAGLADRLLGLLFPHHAPQPLCDPLTLNGFMDETLAELAAVLDNTPLPERLTPGAVEAVLLDSLPLLAPALLEDAEAILAGDPAAEALDEIIFAYPGFYAIALYRLAHVLYQADVPLLPRMLTEVAHRRTGIDIHPGARIGRSFCIDHGTGVVIGETAVIGDRVTLYQGVTIGALAVHKNDQGSKRHPTIEDDVIMYTSAVVLGGDTVVGKGSIIGGNVWLTRSVPPGTRLYHKADNASI